MIVLDEQLIKPEVIRAFARWYKGTVTTLPQLRLGSRIMDEAVPTLLRTVSEPTFVTINYDDFWHVIPASPAYCIICLKLRQRESSLVSPLVREVLSLKQYRTKRARMGAVVSVRGRAVEEYRA